MAEAYNPSLELGALDLEKGENPQGLGGRLRNAFRSVVETASRPVVSGKPSRALRTAVMALLATGAVQFTQVTHHPSANSQAVAPEVQGANEELPPLYGYWVPADEDERR
ncbi:MAG: hypothetical protein V1913_12325 [Fibrobacterota bacterium]